MYGLGTGLFCWPMNLLLELDWGDTNPLVQGEERNLVSGLATQAWYMAFIFYAILILRGRLTEHKTMA